MHVKVELKIEISIMRIFAIFFSKNIENVFFFQKKRQTNGIKHYNCVFLEFLNNVVSWFFRTTTDL